MVDDVVVGFEDPVGSPVVAQELPNILRRIEFGTFCRQRHRGNVGGMTSLSVMCQPARSTTRAACAFGSIFLAISESSRLVAWVLQVGRTSAAPLPCLGADGAEDIGRGGALILRGGGSRSAFRPSTGDFVLLTDAGLVLEPDFYLVDADAFFARDFREAGWEAFLKSSIAPSACAWWRGLAESLR